MPKAANGFPLGNYNIVTFDNDPYIKELMGNVTRWISRLNMDDSSSLYKRVKRRLNEM